MAEHVGELRLRRLRLGELPQDEAAAARMHVDSCGDCRARLGALDLEQRRFEAEVPFERFAAGVARAQRRPQRAKRLVPVAPLLALAAALVVGVAMWPLVNAGQNRLKGGAEIALRIAGPAGAQRDADRTAPEVLSAGERVRIGYKPDGHRYLASVSVDEQGAVTPLYPEQGKSLEVQPGGELRYLPGSLEFYGRGAERVIVVLSDEPLSVDQVKAAARAAYDEAHGDVVRMRELKVPGEKFHQLLLKP
jgi:Domain of unknown function (DUF4384)